MRRLHLAAAAALVGVFSAGGADGLAAQTGFEGVITFRQYSDNGKQSTMVQTSKGHKVRFDGFGEEADKGGAMIIDGDAKMMMMIVPEKKQYMTITEEDMKQMAAMMKPMAEQMKGMKQGETAPGKFDFSNTGRWETVAGVRCEVWHGTYVGDEKREGEACLAKGVGFALYDLMVDNPMIRRRGSAWSAEMQKFRDLVSGGKGILKVTRIENGKSVTEMEATKIEKKAVGDDAFKPPADYTEVKMGAMMQQAHDAMRQMQQRMQQSKP